MNNMDENLQQSLIYNNTSIETGESFDFSTTIQQTTQSQESSITSHGNVIDVAAHTMQHQQILQVLNYLKFYYFSPNDVNFYLVICKIILQDSFNDHNHYDHEFFYQHPSYPTIRYHVSCKLLSYSLVENILNNEMCGINFDTELLSTNDVGNNEMITQTVSSMAGNQNYNDSDFSSNEHITHQDTNGLATRIFQ
ncbi:hypothetical protein RhiirA1_478539 [Rhizophagus irregularis]|uniref:Uncharacterized protein n=4 Tax=Rhizophagus irregularis TaxID=588596 RepID=A0A2N0QRW5_9GLOM|nr:hypothetical protein GLOIN_2v1868476 [Rhizophagus irregularis DAOM 181602=DAOM 197198]PKC53803.1 hypothetical protein RhiirA1_478539 [Rhizophagus irregularis]POG81074.1 hypothetical protein GLOIN_2v1868476 [Rhizophagus irregularis DAOM 181602=DAOM 197198]|eukprot:XP_025187940.1 hypothetical protein GLOIN_2v1868476 [Rhizophagus irregularis DAOM 181602=DAOM 197198]